MKKKIFIGFGIIGILISIVIICQRAEPEVFIIPKGFKGRIMIVFEKKYGMPPKFENGRRLYEIPQTGILVTQFKVPNGFLNSQFYYVDSLNQRMSIKSFLNEKDAEKSNEVGIFYPGISGVYGNSDDSLAVIYNDFMVADYKNLEMFYSKEYRKQFHEALEKAVGYKIGVRY